ncbi:MAG: SfiI family type II restriction endonuclease [Terracidiphilus sp.]
MLIDPASLAQDLDRLEAIEKASLRMVAQALFDIRESAVTTFQNETDLVQDVGEDLTRDALDRMGVSRIDERVFGKIDYKWARYYFHPDFAVRQALFVDSKAEKVEGQGTATLKTAQTSMRIRQIRVGQVVDVPGTFPTVVQTSGGDFLSTTIFVKYNYTELAQGNSLEQITLAAVPNGMLQNIYNPTPEIGFWRAGRNAPQRGEAFRVRVPFSRLKALRGWRVQSVPLPPALFVWDEDDLPAQG